MMTKNNEYLQEAAEYLYIANADEIVRQQCIAREDAERRERTLEHKLEIADKTITEQQKELEHLKQLLAKHGIDA